MFMRFALIVVFSGTAALAAACHRAQPQSPHVAATRAERSVFTDSVLHAGLCEPIRSGEDWRRVCVPKDQAIRPERKR
jgi:hypothetical protein